MSAAVDAAPAPLADLLVRHRIAAGLHQAELASLSGLSERALRDLERGATVRPRRHSVLALASALELAGAELSAFLAASASGRASSDPGGLTTARPDPLVGRHAELRSLHEMIVAGQHRLITVTGAGGVGKTRLAVSLAGELAQRLWDARIVDMSTLDDPSLVLQTVAEVFGEAGTARLGPIERLAARLGGARSVIVVDRPRPLLADGGPDLPARHRSLRATIMSTLDVVTHDAGRLFDLLGAFSGGAGLDDLESVAGAGWRGSSLFDALAELVDTSLVRMHATGGDTRYTLPDTVRDIAKERHRQGFALDPLGLMELYSSIECDEPGHGGAPP